MQSLFLEFFGEKRGSKTVYKDMFILTAVHPFVIFPTPEAKNRLLCLRCPSMLTVLELQNSPLHSPLFRIISEVRDLK